MIKSLYVPGYIRAGITKNHRGTPPLTVMAGDTETCDGIPYLLQLVKEGQEPNVYDVTADTVLPTFLRWCYENTNARDKYAVNVLYFHNLAFDLGAILCKQRDERFLLNQFTVEGDRWILDVKNGKCTFADLKLYAKDETKRETKRVLLIDSFSFYKSSLKDIAATLKLDHQKQDAPFDQGGAEHMRFHRWEIESYAKQDALVELDLARHLVDLHHEYDVKPCVSLPQMAMRIFKHRFLEEGDCLPYPIGFDKGCMLSYHGGRNGYYVEGKPPVAVDGVGEVDVVSMYPWVMSTMPNFLFARYEKVSEFDDNREGVYCLDCEVTPSKYPILFDHGFGVAKGRYRNLWVTSYELRRALLLGDVKIRRINGVVVEETEQRNPFKQYVDHFFERKSAVGKSDPRYLFYKLCANSLYGKTIQNIDHNEGRHFTWDGTRYIEKPRRFRAGGLFNPLIATLITGKARARLNELETTYEALESSTDSIKTTHDVDPKELGSDLGMLEYKFRDYRVYFFRSKLYLAVGDTVEGATHGCMAGKRKWAHLDDEVRDASLVNHERHEELFKMMLNDNYDYEYERMTKVRESIRHIKRRALTMEKREATLNIR